MLSSNIASVTFRPWPGAVKMNPITVTLEHYSVPLKETANAITVSSSG